MTLRFWFDLAWPAPLVALLLAFFVAGAVFGLLAMLGAHIAQRREIARLRRETAPAEDAGGRAVSQPPAAEG